MNARLGLMATAMLATALGCHGGKGAAGPKAGCRGEAAAFGSWLKALLAEGFEQVELPLAGAELVDLGEEKVGKPVEPGTMVALTLDGITVDGEKLAATEAKLVARLKTARQEAMEDPSRSSLLLLVDGSVPWTVVRGVVEAAAEAGWLEVAFVFKGAWRQPTPDPSPIDDELRGGGADVDSPSRKPPYVKVYGDCPAAVAVMEETASMSLADRPRAQVERLPRAVETCGCKVDLGAARRYHWFDAGREQTRYIMAEVPITAEGGKPLTAPATAPWSGAHKGVVQVAKTGIGSYTFEISQ